MGLRARLGALAVTGIQQKLKDAIFGELTTIEKDIEQEVSIMQKAWVDLQDIAHLEAKAEKLNKSGAVSSVAEELIKQGEGLIKRYQQSTAA